MLVSVLLRFQNDLLDFTLDGNGHIKIAGLKETENRAEGKAHIESPVLFFGVVSAEALREGTGGKPFDLYGRASHFYGFDPRLFADLKAQQLPAIASQRKNCSQDQQQDKEYGDDPFQ